MYSNNELYSSLMNILRFGKCELRKISFNVEKISRIIIKDKKYEAIARLKNTHCGERCFILCTGPSLTKEDIMLLRNEFTIGMNSICKLFSETDWRPSIYGIQDLFVYDKLIEDFGYFTDKTLCLIGNNIAKNREISDFWIQYPLYRAYHDYDSTILHKYYTYFSDDCYKVVYNGYSITYSLLQIAVYMGFDEIYLLGADNNYNGKKQHFIEHGHNGTGLDTAADRLNAAYLCAKEYADNHDIKIVNATRGGMLEVFPRNNLEEILMIQKG